VHNDLKINDHYKLLREKVEAVFDGITFGEYGCTTSGTKTIRGPHVTAMIPAEKPLDPKGFKRVVELINAHLCDVEWDGNVRFVQHDGGIYGKTHMAELIMDKKEKP